MSLKMKLVSLVSMFLLILATVVVSVFAIGQAEINLGGSINFQATNVYAKLTGSILGGQGGEIALKELTFSQDPSDNPSSSEDIATWLNNALNFTSNGDAITFNITVENKASDRSLYFTISDKIGTVENLTKTVSTESYPDALDISIEIPKLSTRTFTILFEVNTTNLSVNGEYKYLITLSNESVSNVEISAESNNESLGTVSVNGGDLNKFNVGETVTLEALPTSINNTFIAWAVPKEVSQFNNSVKNVEISKLSHSSLKTLSINSSDIDIVSTEQSYSFILNSNSPKVYYAIFNQTTEIIDDGILQYKLFKEAGLAEVYSILDKERTELTVPSSIVNNETSYNIFRIGIGALGDNRNKLENVILSEGITTIGNSAFSGTVYLKTISLPSSLKEILVGAFHSSAIESIVLPNSLTNIDKEAFYGCRNLVSIVLPESLTNIGEKAFASCTKLTTINIPSNVNNIGGGAFAGGDLFESTFTSFSVSDANNYFKTTENKKSLLSKNGETLYAVATAGLNSYTIPVSVKTIKSYTFYNATQLETINISNGVEIIEASSFGLVGIKSLLIPESVKEIAHEAFYMMNLESIVVDGENKNYKSINNCLIEIASETLLLGCKNSVLTTELGIKKIGDYAFHYCQGLETIVIPEGVSHIGNYSFNLCGGLKSITIASTVIDIGPFAFNRSAETIILSGIYEGSDGHGYYISDFYNKWMYEGEIVQYLNQPGTYTAVKSN